MHNHSVKSCLCVPTLKIDSFIILLNINDITDLNTKI